MKTRMKAKAGLRKRTYWTKPLSAKYIERSPMIAKIFEVKAMKRRSSSGMSVGKMPRTAGIESKAKIRSVPSTTSSTRKSGVKTRRPFSTAQNALPWRWEVSGMHLRATFTMKFSSTPLPSSSSLENANLTPVKSRKAPNSGRSHVNWSTAATPTMMKSARIATAPRMPQNSTRCWRRSGMPKWAKTRMKMKRLSTESASSRM